MEENRRSPLDGRNGFGPPWAGRLIEKTGVGRGVLASPWTNTSSAMSLSSTSLPCRRKLRMNWRMGVAVNEVGPVSSYKGKGHRQ